MLPQTNASHGNDIGRLVHLRKCSSHSGSDLSATQLTMDKRTFEQEQILCKPPQRCEELTEIQHLHN